MRKNRATKSLCLIYLKSPSPNARTMEAGGKRLYFGFFSAPKQQLTPVPNPNRGKPKSIVIANFFACISSYAQPEKCSRRLCETPSLEYKPLQAGRQVVQTLAAMGNAGQWLVHAGGCRLRQTKALTDGGNVMMPRQGEVGKAALQPGFPRIALNALATPHVRYFCYLKSQKLFLAVPAS